MVPRWQRTYVVTAAYVAAWALTYVVVHYGGLPRLVHFQREGVFRLVDPPWGPEPSDYLGLNLWAALAAVLAAGLAALWMSKKKQPLGPRALFVGGAWSVLAVVVAGSYYAWHNWP